MTGTLRRGRLAITAAALAVAAATPARAAGLGLSLQGTIGAGALGRDLHSQTNATYGAIGGLHFRGPLALELEYQYAENTLNSFGSAKMRQDGVLGHLRFDLLTRTFNPFVYGGVGWIHYSAGELLNAKADRVVIPVGGGAELHFGFFVVGARAEFQWVPNDVQSERLSYWKAIGTIGFHFR
jgi:opacity protein-like surface antigen